jgi:UDP-N-acetyl-D-glucosamine dehydrogenase
MEQRISGALANKLSSKKAVVGIIGMGYVGLPLSLAFAANGLKVKGIDIDPAKVDAINTGKSYFSHILSERVADCVSRDNLLATTDFSVIRDCDCIIICVPTPLGIHNEPDLSFILQTMQNVKPYLRNDQILCLESTTYPGTTEEIIAPIINELGFEIGEDFFLAFSPEREDPGNPSFDTRSIPKVLGGFSQKCGDIAETLYSIAVERVVRVSNCRTAELTKLLENIHRAVNIGLVNEMKTVSDALDINIHEVISAAATKPFGFTEYRPGPGLGGHCIPIDPFYLTWKAKEFGISTKFIELAGEINSSMPAYVVGKVRDVLNVHKKPMSDSSILVLGLAYKKNIDDSRESPALSIIEKLIGLGASVSVHDPFITHLPKTRKFDLSKKNLDLVVSLSESILSRHDLTLIVTDHDCFDYDLIGKASNLIVDTRGRYVPSARIITA